MRSSSLVLAALFASAVAACTASSTGSADPSHPSPVENVSVVQSEAQRDTSPTLAPAEATQFAADQADFALDLYQAVRKDAALDGKDVFLSPHSVSTALAMTYAGARSTTAAEMKKALHFGLPDDRLHKAFDWLDLALSSRGQNAKGKDDQPFRLKVASSIWGQKSYAFQTPFLDTLAVDYGAGLNAVDFVKDATGATHAINAWVEQKTENRIKNLVPDGALDPDTRLVLVNAVYFNAAWASKFEPTATKPGTFTKLDGSTVQVEMMHGGAQRRYAKADGFEAVELPYDGGELSMMAIAPDSGTFGTFEASLTGRKVLDIFAAMAERTVIVGFPKVKLDAAFDLTAPLAGLGMETAFSPGTADFSGIADDHLYMKGVLHKTFLELDENGTEAAAATAVIAGTTSAPQDPPVTVTFDRPYLIAIVDRATKTLVFFGRIVDPKAS